MFLFRHLATGEAQSSLALNYLIGATTANEIIRETTWVIWKKLEPIVMPKPTKESFEEIARGFWNRWDVPNCCGSLDGKLIRIKVCWRNSLLILWIHKLFSCSLTQMPPHSGSDYWCFKGFHAMILLGLCDYRYRFVMADFGAKGRASDGGVFANSLLGQKLKANQMDLPPPKFVPEGPLLPHFFLGDEAFGLSDYMMTPYPGTNFWNFPNFSMS